MKKLYILLGFLLLATLIVRFVDVDFVEVVPERADVACRTEPGSDVITKDSQPLCAHMKSVQDEYTKVIEPIFVSKCLMCHGSPQKLPLYSRLPLVSGLVDHDIDEAREDFDMRYGFPFKTKPTIKSQSGSLHELLEVMDENSMPPLVYKVMHWSSSLSADEMKIIRDWVDSSKKLLKSEIATTNPN